MLNMSLVKHSVTSTWRRSTVCLRQLSVLHWWAN